MAEELKQKKEIEKFTKEKRNESIRHLFIDTSIFEENNFFKGKLIRLYQYVKDGYIKLYTNAIVINEVKSRISKKISKAKNNCVTLFNDKDSYILGNTSLSNSIKQLKNRNYFERETEKLCFDFDKVVNETPFIIIPYDDIDFAKVVNDYFSSIPPFKEGDKKSEFPDAFIISSIEKYCEKNKVQITAISNDNDWLDCTTKNFIISNNLNSIFEDITKNEEYKIDYVTHLVEIHKDEILKQIKKYIIKNVYFENTDYADSDITAVALRELEIFNEGITYIDKTSAEIQLDIKMDITADITYPDYENAVWDNEDEIYYFLEEVTSNQDFSTSADALLLIEYDINDKSFFKSVIESFNNDKPVSLTIEYNN